MSNAQQTNTKSVSIANAIPSLLERPDPDRETQALFNLLGRGETAGVFQVESDGMRKVLMQMKPSRFQHIVAVLALYRPGPMQYIPDYIARMHGKQEVEYRHPALVEILGDTYGIIVYQEQIMQIASELAGYTPGEADMIRKAVGKKQHTEIAYHRNKFISGCVENGIDEKTASAIYTDIEKFANYGFNRAHATDYAKVTCQTAFLKAHYPVEYMAALLSVERNKTDKVARNLAEVRRMGFRIKPPDINESEKEFSIGSPEDGAPVIRFGLGAIKNVGDGPVDEILVEREVNGPFADLVDFAARINLKSMGKRPLEAFTYAGVFDCWGSRDQIFAVLDQAITYSHNKHKAASTGQMSLFGERMDMDDDILIPDAQDVQPDPLQLLAKEKEMLGFYVSEHPLEKWIEVTRNKISATSGILRYLDKQRVLLLGLVTGVHHYTTRNGQPMAFVQMEDLESSFNLVIFSGEWEKYRKYVAINRILFVSGDVQVEDEKISIIVKGLHPVERHSEVREQTMYHIPDYIIRETETDDVDNESYDEAESATDEKNDIVSQPASHINNETQANGATAGVATIQSAELNISNNGDQVFHNPTLPSSSIARWQMEYESPVYEELDTPPTCIQFTIAPTTHWQAVIRKIVTVLPEQVPGTCSVVICIAGSNLEAYFKHATVEWSPDLFERVRLLPNIIEVVPYIELEERETPPVMQRQAMVVA